MVGGLTSGAFSGSNTDSESNYSRISASHPSFLEEFQNAPVPKFLKPITQYTDRLETPEKDVTGFELCDSVLKYINGVLMEDDDLEDDACMIKETRINDTKRSFHEVIVGHKHHVDESDKQVETDYDMRNNKIMAAHQSIVHDMLGRFVFSYGKSEEFSLNKHYGALPRRKVNKKEAVDMRNLLLKCMEFVASSDYRAANKLMKEIRSKSCAYGHGTQRLAHYFADGLQARLDGRWIEPHRTLAIKPLYDADLLKALKIYVTDFPFLENAYFFANQMIMDLVENETSTLHIIHFGIMHGRQWPSLIQRLSQRPGGPLKLRITGIDFPQKGFRPDARVKETGCQLTSYCKEFSIPFEYNCFAESWDMIKLEDLKIKKEEVVVVNCMFHFMYLLDDTVLDSSPRDNALNLIKRINPDLFIHVVVNGTYNSPFFLSRFREALFQYATWFDMFDAILPRESPERMVFESEVWGREVLNIIVSEGLERVERPETYKQWQKRTTRAGFKSLPLNLKIFRYIQNRVKSKYHKDFFVEQAGNWLLDGWKGRPLFAMSTWKPA